jgi:hypothetical protein
MTILAEAGDLRRFQHHRQFLKFCGMDIVTLSDFKLIEGHLKKGALCFFHDYLARDIVVKGKRKTADKCKDVKPYLNQHKDWRLRKMLKPPASVGFALWEKI